MVTSSDERRFFSNLIRLIFFAVSLATVISFLSPVHWLAELFSNFRFYYLLIQALLVLIFLHSERRQLMLSTLLLAIPNAWYVVPYLTPLVLDTSVAAERGEEIDVVALNVNYRNNDHQSMRAYLDSVTADIIVLSEVTKTWRDELHFLNSRYPHQIGKWRSDPWGMRVYSRLPFVEAELLDLGVSNTVHARVVIETEGRRLQVFAVHLFTPTNPQRAANRNRQLANLARHVGASNLRTVIVGDLNVTPFSPYFNRFLGAAGVVDARRPTGFHFTWPTSAIPVWIPIDHALAHPAVSVTKVQRGRAAGSDHYPLEISIACCGADSG